MKGTRLVAVRAKPQHVPFLAGLLAATLLLSTLTAAGCQLISRRPYAEGAGETITLKVGETQTLKLWTVHHPEDSPWKMWYFLPWDEQFLKLVDFGTDLQSKPGWVGQYLVFKALAPGTTTLTFEWNYDGTKLTAEYTFVIQ